MKLDPNVIESNFRFPHKGPTEFGLRGENTTFGRYSCFGEVVEMATGGALGVLTDQDGDRIVGAVTLTPNPEQTLGFHFSWRQSVRLSDGRTYRNTGKFADQLPAGLVVVDIGPTLTRLIKDAIDAIRRL